MKLPIPCPVFYSDHKPRQMTQTEKGSNEKENGWEHLWLHNKDNSNVQRYNPNMVVSLNPLYALDTRNSSLSNGSATGANEKAV